MRALTIDGHGGMEQIRVRDDLPVPPVESPGDVRIRVRAASLNHLDLFVVGGLPGIRIVPPWILGSDAMGIVDAVGAAVVSVKPGARVVINPGIGCGTCEYCRSGEAPLCLKFAVLGEHRPGSFADYVVVPGTHVCEVPLSISDEVAAAFPLAGLTAWRMVVGRARVAPGERVLVQGIGSPVSLAALQIARLRGAEVWVTSSSDAKLERARELGATETINYRTHDVAKEVRARTGKRGVDVVIDSAGRESWPGSLGALGRRGRLVACGGTTGPIVEVDVRRMFWNQWTLMGSTMSNEAEFAAVMAEFVAGRLTMPVDSVFALERGREAFERLASGRQFGKVVLGLVHVGG